MKKLLLIACAIALTATSVSTEQNGTKTFPLTVDSIMRGPELVGNPPNNLRWSGDSKELYFEWLIPKEDQSSMTVRPVVPCATYAATSRSLSSSANTGIQRAKRAPVQ